MKLTNKILFVLMLLPFMSCDDMLEPEIDGAMSEEGIWGNTVRAFGFLNNAYNNLPGGYTRISGTMLAAGTDDAVCPDPLNPIHTFYDGTWSSYNTIDEAWSLNYEGIRKANTFLLKADDIPLPRLSNALGTDEQILRTRERMKGEAFFLRAYFYFELVKRYGGVPLTNNVLTPEMAAEMPRASIDECFEFIMADCDSAISRLPRMYGAEPVEVGFNDAKELGRATSGAALALKARALLYRASPLFNESGDNSYYELAAETAREVIDLTINMDGSGNTVYGLNRFSSTLDLNDLFSTNSVVPLYNKEILFSTQYSSNRTIEFQNAPISFGGKGMINPTQNLVDAFPMKNGKPISDATSGYNPDQPLLNRDPRLAMTVLTNGTDFLINDKSGEIETFVSGADGPGSYPNATKTGHYLRKFMMPQAVWDGRTVNVTRTWVLIRLSEVYLNYAEARNEAFGPDAEVYDAIMQLRRRAGLRPASLEAGLSQQEMRKVIQNERRIELAFEEHRLFDLRRWKAWDDPAAQEALLKIRGIRITRDEAGNFVYDSGLLVQQRIFTENMYFYPIPESEILKSNALVQNPGW